MVLTIDIKKSLISDYLNFLFQTDEDGCFLVTRKNLAGRFICAMVEYSYKPTHNTGSVTMVLPSCPALKSGEKRYIYLSTESQAKVNDYLEAIFDLDFERYWMQGVKMNIPQKDIIYAFINSRKLATFEQDPETLKKRIYRSSTRKLQSIYKQLLNKAHYTDRIISEQLKDDVI